LLFIDEAGFSDIKSRKYLSRFNKIFNKAGKFREYQIHKNLYTHYRKKAGGAVPKLLSHLTNLENQSKTAYHDFMPGIEFKKLYETSDSLKKELKAISPGTLNKKLHMFIRSRIDLCYQYMFNYKYEIHLHDIRKYLKQIRFVIGEKLGDLHKQIENDINFQDIKNVEDMLGEWHDRDEFKLLLDDFTATNGENLGEEEQVKLEKLKQKVAEDIHKDITKLRPQLLHLFSLSKAVLDRK
jgi:CHAD domain-containing protein